MYYPSVTEPFLVRPMPHPPRIMYIECKGDALTGAARIGRVRYSKTGSTLYYRDQEFRSLKGAGDKANYYDVLTGDGYWISGCKKNGGDRLYPGEIVIDDDVREEYWTVIRQSPEQVEQRRIRCTGKYNHRSPR